MNVLFKHRNRFAVGVILLLVVGWLLILPRGGYVNVFRAVTDGPDPSNILYREQAAQGGKPQHLISNGLLYLETTRIREGWLADWVNYRVRTDWDNDDIARLRRDLPHLESYWPDPSKRNGGIEWIPESSNP